MFDKQKHLYRAMIRVNKKLHHIGYFNSAVLAAAMYDYHAEELYGQDAILNFHGNLPHPLK